MLISKGFVQLNRQALRDLHRHIDEQAQKRRGQRPNVVYARVVLQAIIANAGYETTPDKRMELGVWKTTYREIGEYTGLDSTQVRSTLSFLGRLTQQGADSLMLLKINTLTKNQYSNSTGTYESAQGKSSKLNRVGIAIKALFLQGILHVGNSNSTGLKGETQPVITKKKDFKEKEKKSTRRFPPNLVHGRPEQTPGENGKVKNGGLEKANNEMADNPETQSPNDHGHEDPLEPALQTNRREGDTTQVGSEIKKQKRQVERTTEGKPNLTAQKSGITLVEAVEKYPELEKGIKYLTRLNGICETLHPTHLDKFKRLVRDDIVDPKTNGSELVGILNDFRKSDLHFDTVKSVIDRMLTDWAPIPTELPVAQLSAS